MVALSPRTIVNKPRAAASPERADRAADNNDHHRADQVVPEEGDVTLCFGCGEWCVFDYGMHLRKPTDKEFDEIGTDPDCMGARWAWTEAKKLQISEEEAKRRAH